VAAIGGYKFVFSGYCGMIEPLSKRVTIGGSMRQLFLGLLLSLVLVQYSGGQVVYNLAVNNQIDGLSGTGDTFIGQTFVVPASDNVLSQFSVYIMNSVGTPSGTAFYTFNVASWDTATNTTAGPALYTSSVQMTPETFPNLTEVTFTPNITLVPSANYVAYLDASGYGSATTLLGGNYLDAYPAGALVFAGEQEQPWTVYQNGQDLAFGATFLPEPTSLGICSVLALLGSSRPRRKAIPSKKIGP
jgi:hypothetical protein